MKSSHVYVKIHLLSTFLNLPTLHNCTIFTKKKMYAKKHLTCDCFTDQRVGRLM